MLTFDTAAEKGLVSPNTTVSKKLATGTTYKTVELKPTSAGSVVVADVITDAETIKVVTSDNGLTLAGTGGVLFGDTVKTVEVAGTNGLTLGYNDAMEYKGGQINAAVSVDASNVTAEAGSWRINNDVTLANEATIGTADSDADLTITGAVKGTGTLNVNGGMLSVNAMQDGIGITAQEGVISVSQKYADPDAQTPDKIPAFYGAINPGTITWNTATSHDAAIIGLGTSSADSVARFVQSIYGDDTEKKNILVVQSQVSNMNVQFGNVGSSYATNMIIDLGAVAQTSYFDAEDGVIQGSLSDGETLTRAPVVDSEIVLTNLNANALFNKDVSTADGVKQVKHLKIAASSSSNVRVDYGTLFYGDHTSLWNLDTDWDASGKLKALKNYGHVEADGTISFAANEAALDLVSGLNVFGDIKNSVEGVSFGQNEIADTVVFGLDDYIVRAYNESVDLGIADADDRTDYVRGKLRAAEEAINTASNMAVAGGAFSTAIDINNEIWKALDRRTSLANLNAARNAYGVTPWVDVIGTWNTADSLFGDSGYEADIYGAVIGADWTAPCGAILGLAFNVGQADGNSKDSPVKVENDVDFWGVSLYGSHQIGKFNGKFDLGYLSTSNDLSTHTVLGSFDESLDADIFTIGLGGEYIVNAGSFNVVPHAGIRWSRIDMDDSKFGADYDAMNLFQMPIGVAFSGTFETNGWKLAPMFDIAVVPAFGDKDAVANFTGGIEETTRVVDTNPIQATLGLNATVDAWTFGVNYGLTAGGDDRLNNSFNLNARYTF